MVRCSSEQPSREAYGHVGKHTDHFVCLQLMNLIHTCRRLRVCFRAPYLAAKHVKPAKEDMGVSFLWGTSPTWRNSFPFGLPTQKRAPTLRPKLGPPVERLE